ncbi:hypothetical protein AGDE_15235 [Angomonas deanei]|uniref:RecF/RecN/SMC N terminal domain/AAA domain, putative AbiEii toxin, Type IV TA system, putative n=1 Tax=Angomonas deanei TaxID=59799 RepID=A0A7G2CRV1_9TRYP|nr:hypothetical protein AGDE_15235 [Angomonas deanei]CAD2222480.1 RecF/RecN/SMC N terminal domain/AAA domain, putative AbiEii toxin, Type IV TA system, putative [Angomonas deanei]|eukprot:EPY19444.1 hypothetical protein AGDE_15235 [Angomonas deanei]
MKESEEELQQCQSEKIRLAQLVKETRDNIADIQTRYKQSEEHRIKLEKEIDAAQEEKNGLLERKVTLDNLIRNMDVDLKEAHKTLEAGKNFMAEQERRYSWIVSERDSFGDPQGPFYFTDEAKTQKTLAELREAEAQSAMMSRRVTQKTTVLYEDRRKEYDDLVLQRAALGEDKDAIHACIRGIEYKKWTSLDRMVNVVSTIFGKLFAACLPGASAELIEERDAQQHLTGLSVCVRFNGKPKESLSELSGGQRSLLALCLILAILRVRPAPIYILDEVDAALDPSHTQNIGLMLQKYFPNSQFLLVSLKDGMFNSANVLYHIRNTQGYSEVARIEHSDRGDGETVGDKPPSRREKVAVPAQ